MDRQIIRQMEYYSAVKMNELLIYTAAWMNCKNIMLSKTPEIPLLPPQKRSHLRSVEGRSVIFWDWDGGMKKRFCIYVIFSGGYQRVQVLVRLHEAHV